MAEFYSDLKKQSARKGHHGVPTQTILVEEKGKTYAYLLKEVKSSVPAETLEELRLLCQKSGVTSRMLQSSTNEQCTI